MRDGAPRFLDGLGRRESVVAVDGVEELARRVGRPVVMDREPDFPVHGAETINEVEA